MGSIFESGLGKAVKGSPLELGRSAAEQALSQFREFGPSLALVVGELVQNALHHGLGEKRDGRISIRIERTDSLISSIVQDDGPGLTRGAFFAGVGLARGTGRFMKAPNRNAHFPSISVATSRRRFSPESLCKPEDSGSIHSLVLQ